MVIDKADKLTLLDIPAFKHFLLSLIQSAGIFDVSDREDDGRHLFREGRRSLGLEVLRMMDEAQPVPNPSGIPATTLIQTLMEFAQSAPKEKPVGRRDAYADIGDDGDDGG